MQIPTKPGQYISQENVILKQRSHKNNLSSLGPNRPNYMSSLQADSNPILNNRNKYQNRQIYKNINSEMRKDIDSSQVILASGSEILSNKHSLNPKGSMPIINNKQASGHELMEIIGNIN